MTPDVEAPPRPAEGLPALLVLSGDDSTIDDLLPGVSDLLDARLLHDPGDVAMLAVEAIAPLVLLPWAGPASDALWTEAARTTPGLLPLAWVGPDARSAFEASEAARLALAVLVPPLDRQTFRLEMRALLAVRERLLTSTEAARRADSELASFLYVVSHDLKAPIQGLLGVAGLLSELEGHRLSEDGREYCEELERNGQRLARMVDALTTMSRLGRSGVDARVVDLGGLVEDVFAEIIFRYGERIPRLEHDDDLPKLVTDPALLEEVVRRLVDNAVVHHGPGPPRVNVRCDVVSAPGDGVVLTVEDDGPGIPEAYRDQIFEIFAGPGVGRGGDVGAGLAVAHRAVSLLDGRIWFEERPDGGSAFHVELPGRVTPARPR